MKKGKLLRTLVFGFWVFSFSITSVMSQTPSEAAACAQEMIAHHVGSVVPEAGCALQLATQLRRMHNAGTSSPNFSSIRDDVAGAFTSCYPAMPNANTAVKKLIDRLDEINDVNATTFGGSTCLENMWRDIDAELARANRGARLIQQSQNSLDRAFANTSGSRADPHIITLDRLRYDFQAEGIFTALINTKGDFEIQVLQRQSGFPASHNEAVAIKYGRTIVNLTMSTPNIFVNGTPFTGNFPAMLSDGLQITQIDPAVFLITTPKGDSILIKLHKKLLDYFVRLSPYQIGVIRGGILGNYDLNNKNDLSTSTSEVIKTADKNNRELLYQVFGKSWRIEPKRSLFVDEIKSKYPSFDAKYPERDLKVTDIPQNAKELAQKICLRKGIEDKEILEDCVYDLAITKNPEFADSAEFAQKVKRNPDAFFKQNPPAAGSGFRGSYSFDYTYSNGIKQFTTDFEVAVGDDKSAFRYKSKNGVGLRVIINHAEKYYLNITQLDDKKIQSFAVKQPFSREMVKDQPVEKTRTEMTKTIAGYICRKYLYKGRSITGEIWVAESLKQTQLIPVEYLIGLEGGFVFVATLPKFLSMNEEGMVLEANLTQQKNSYVFRVKSINTTPNQALFDLTGIKILNGK
jgi:von Willebrand factor type D domain